MQLLLKQLLNSLNFRQKVPIQMKNRRLLARIILGDPEADSGGERKSKRSEK